MKLCNGGGRGLGDFFKGGSHGFREEQSGISRHQQSIKEVPSNIDRPLTANEGDYENSTEPTG